MIALTLLPIINFGGKITKGLSPVKFYFSGEKSRFMSIQTQEKMFTFLGERLCLDFANTVSEHISDHPTDYLRNYADLVSWARQANIVTAEEAQQLQLKADNHPDQAAAVLHRARTLRKAIYQIFSLGLLTVHQRPTTWQP